MPTLLGERPVMSAIPRNVSADLRDPVRSVMASFEFRETIFEIPSVPEIAVAEDDDVRCREHNVRSPRKSLNVDPVAAKPDSSQSRSQCDLRLCISLSA
jgi:hypothetical protein